MSLPRAALLRELGLWPQWRLKERSSAASPPMSAGESRAQKIARMDWDELTRAILQCDACPLHLTRTQGVPGVGDRNADWLIVGEAPGADEDAKGEPFVGQAGKLLDAMLAAIDLTRGRNVYIANVLKSRPPGNRNPAPKEIAACLPYLQRQIELIQPRIIFAVGRFAAQALLDTEEPIGRLRGRVHHYRDIPVVVSYHPAYLLRSPAEKAKSWEDLCLARRVVAQGAQDAGADP